ncbi:MAG: hypothetical protein IPG43_06080 [Proteobacteria bacterium]|nr:hypothetical protein [Pseudomonadota bacterium]
MESVWSSCENGCKADSGFLAGVLKHMGLIGVLLSFAAVQNVANACKCFESTLDERYRSATAVFIGQISKIDARRRVGSIPIFSGRKEVWMPTRDPKKEHEGVAENRSFTNESEVLEFQIIENLKGEAEQPIGVFEFPIFCPPRHDWATVPGFCR